MHPLAEKHAEAMGIVFDGYVPLDEEEPPDAAAAVQ
jgi:hypothetical protein